MASSPIIEGNDLNTFEILSGGSVIPDTYEVLEIRIDQDVNKIAEAEITLRDGDTAEQDFEIASSSTFIPGAEIEIKLGYEGKDDSVFKGVVIKQMVLIEEGQGSKLQVICKDKALKLTVNRNNNTFTDTTDSDMVSSIASDAGLQTDITSTSTSHKEVIQYYATDWDFIITRAEVNGMLVITDSGKLVMAKPDVSSSPALKVTYGIDMIEFEGQLDATHQLTGVESNSWDMSTQAVINATGSEPSVNEQGNISGSTLADVLGASTTNLISSATVSQDAIQDWANAALLKSRLSRFKGSVNFVGSALAKVNSTIELSGMGARFDGNAFISGVTHLVTDGRWTTELRLGISPEWFVNRHTVTAPTASGLLPGIRGLQIGIVKKIDEDPDNEFRVQVSIPILGTEADPVWARLGTFYTGGAGFGAYFYPEVNDEVILGFMNDDPRYPVILGSVYSSSITAPETPDADNTIKTLITKAGLQIKFDDENKVITVLTPGGNTMVFSDQDEGITITDQNSNKITMGSDGVTVDSQSSLTLKAAQDVNIQGMSVSIKGDQSFDASSAQVSISGDSQTTVSGGGQCEVSASGNMSIKGAAVIDKLMNVKKSQIKSFLGTGWGFPPTFSNHTSGGTQMVSKEKDIHESLQILLRTTPGERVMLPDYGCDIQKFLFESLSNSRTHLLKETIRTAIIKYEPRIILKEIVIEDENALDGIIEIKLGYTVKSNNTRFNLVLPYYREEGTDIPGIFKKQTKLNQES